MRQHQQPVALRPERLHLAEELFQRLFRRRFRRVERELVDNRRPREFLLESLQYGCPPHGGIAFGLDRIVMLLAGAESIRDVIAFPKTQTAHCPLTDAPTGASPSQLRELGIRVRTPASVPTAGAGDRAG